MCEDMSVSVCVNDLSHHEAAVWIGLVRSVVGCLCAVVSGVCAGD